MTQLQKLAWLNLLFFPLMAVVIVLSKFGILSRSVQHTLLGLLLAAVLVAMILMAKMPWHKGTVEDERDRRFRQRSFATAYLVLICCLSVGLIIAIVVVPGEQVPLKFIAGGLGLAFMASVLGQSASIVIQYRKGLRDVSR